MLSIIDSVYQLWQSVIDFFIRIGRAVAESPFIDFVCDYIIHNQNSLLLILILIIIVYIIEWIRYTIKWNLHVNNDTVNLGSITVSGPLGKIINQKEIAIAVSSEFNTIKECLENMKREVVHSSPAQATSVDYYFFFSGIEGNLGYTRQRTTIPVINGLKNNPVQQTDITIGIGNFKIPVSDILRWLIVVVGLLPVIPRNHYKKSLIHITIISQDKQAKIVVHRDKALSKDLKKLLSVKDIGSFTSIDDLDSLLRDLAFMILDIQNTFQNFDWKSLRYLMDGFEHFTQFRNSGLIEDRNRAKEKFHKAIMRDPENNHHALFYYGVMLMVDRTARAIEQAKKYFKMAKRTDDVKLKALIEIGLAFCYAQSYHRLGKKDKKTIEEARSCIQQAGEHWNKRYENEIYIEKIEKTLDKNEINQDDSNIEIDHKAEKLPLIPYMEATISFVRAAHLRSRSAKKKELNNAINLSYKASLLDPLNSIFKNHVGYGLMEMSKAGIQTLDISVILPNKERKTAILAERYLLEALELNPKNKLTHANLCLLYSLRYFVKENNKGDHNLIYLKARFHGLKATKLDENYINGYRDLCLAFIRYNKINLAEEYYLKALEKAETPSKDSEIVKEIIKEAYENKIPKHVINRWSALDPVFFEPH